MKKANDKIFDNVFRTMLEKMPQLMIPLINEAFHTDYCEEDLKAQLKNEHHDVMSGLKRVTDSLLHVRDKKYHIECQKNADDTMAIRMFEYDVAIALEESRNHAKSSNAEIKFPDSCILYLTHNKSVGETVSVPVRFADGHIHKYSVQVLKAQEYSKEEIFQKNLHVLLPYYILRYERGIAEFEKDETKRGHLLKEYESILKQLQTTTNQMIYTNLTGIIKEILDYEIQEGSKLKKGMDEIMGGEVMELYTERAVRLDRSATVDKLVQKMGMAEEDACEFMNLKLEDYRLYKDSQKEKQQETSESLPRHQARRR